jgi:hypothetical protein
MRQIEPRQVNVIEGVGEFLRRWVGSTEALLQPPAEQMRAESGNINIAGTNWASQSLLLARSDPGFKSMIEAEVLPLVEAVINRGWISYTSCEGHSYLDGSFDERHVGLIPRNQKEREAISISWEQIGHKWQGSHRAHPCEFAIMTHVISCEGGVQIEAIDLYIARRNRASQRDYFAGLSEATSFAVGLLA